MQRAEPTRNVVVTQWFIQSDDGHKALGPFRPNELLERVRNGEVTRQTKIRRDVEATWFTAGDVGGLFEAAMRPTIQYVCPACENEVSEATKVCPHCNEKIRRAKTRIIENTIIDRADPPQTDPPPPVNDAQRIKRVGDQQESDQPES